MLLTVSVAAMLTGCFEEPPPVVADDDAEATGGTTVVTTTGFMTTTSSSTSAGTTLEPTTEVESTSTTGEPTSRSTSDSDSTTSTSTTGSSTSTSSTSGGPGDPVCGDGVAERDEECDGDDLGTNSCESLGFAGGTLGCRNNCDFDQTACTNTVSICALPALTIPDDSGLVVTMSPDFTGWVVDDMRAHIAIDHLFINDIDASLSAPGTEFELPLFEGLCTMNDGSDLDVTLQDGTPDLSCNVAANPSVDGIAAPAVPFHKFRGAPASGSWTVRFEDTFPGGEGMLNNLCLEFDLVPSFQSVCGDNFATFGEPCDSADLAGQDCTSLGHGGGVLSCDDCVLDTTQCSTCGDNVLEDGEVCDGTALGVQTCLTSGPTSCVGCQPVFSECSTQFTDFCFGSNLPFNSGGSVIAPIDVTASGQITDVDVRVIIDHPFVVDVSLTLEHDGDSVGLLNNECPMLESDVDAWFNAEGTQSVDCVEPIAVEGNLGVPGLATFNDAPADGNWVLTIDNADMGSGGELLEWCISIETTGA